jgi:hypothetical protein
MIGGLRRARLARQLLGRARRMRLWGIQRPRGIGRLGLRQAAYDTAGDYYDTGREDEIAAKLRQRRHAAGPSTESRGWQQPSEPSRELILRRVLNLLLTI